MRILYRILTLNVNSFSKIIGNLKIIHPERLRDIEGCIIAPNHIKACDAPFIMSIFQKEMYLIAKKE
ncbi:MAG: 1-acyl-sn-glycerol-3-phosphate acyltransferase, partial [Candidatus Cloacimonetes bacterium]|nr:1-acyl-sn-glycerol-3-phosphate acyltransferase [Candidatus Cloacimonadota bacterium]